MEHGGSIGRRASIDGDRHVCGHRIGTAEGVSAVLHSDAVAEAAVVGSCVIVKGQGIYAYVLTLMISGRQWTRRRSPEEFADRDRPKLDDPGGVPPSARRSGRSMVMRRILRKVR